MYDAGLRLTSKKKGKAANLIHLKFVDDMTIAEASKMKKIRTCTRVKQNFTSLFPFKNWTHPT